MRSRPVHPFLQVLATLLAGGLVSLVVTLLLSLGGGAEAQFTGGSVGGGSFGGGGGGGGGSSDHHYGGGGGGDGGALIQLIFFLFRVNPALGVAALVVVLVYLVWSSSRRSGSGGHHGEGSVGSYVPPPTSRTWFQVDITEVRIAVDARARVFLQRELMEQGRRANASSKVGLVQLLHLVVRAMQRSQPAWTYAGAKNFHPMSPLQAEAAFRRLASDARSKFTHELVRNDAGGVREGQGHGVKRSVEREGEGVVLITLIVAAGREIVDFEASSRTEVMKVLNDLALLTPQNLVAMELSWMPADETDLMSTATLEALHPDMKLLPGAVGGRRFCGYCNGPFAAELPRCPHCGAPTGTAGAPGA